MEYKRPYSKIEFNKRNSNDRFEVDWESWTLKRSVNELHQLSFALKEPDTWIDFTSDTGFYTNIGDEVRLNAIYSHEAEKETLRFGGYINNIKADLDAIAKVSVESLDWKYALKNKQVFLDYYKLSPINIGLNTDSVGTINQHGTLYTMAKKLCEMVGFTDFTKLKTPYMYINNSGTPFEQKTGTYSSSISNLGYGTPKPGIELRMNDNDTDAMFYLYGDGSSSEEYDLMEYPNLIFNYHYPEASGAKIGLKLVISGTEYIIPLTSDIPGSASTALDAVEFPTTKQFTTININLRELMDARFPDTSYKVDRIEIGNQNGDGVGTGRLYFDDIGIADDAQKILNTKEYKFTDALDIINTCSQDCYRYFDINPYKQPYTIPYHDILTNKMVIEGENLLSASVTYDDGNLVNNEIVISELDEAKGIIGHSVNDLSILRHGEYNKVEENNEIKDNASLIEYTHNKILANSKLAPSLSCDVIPSFGYREGMIIYVFIPSFGIDRSMMINDVTWTHDGGCSITFGLPDDFLSAYLKSLEKKVDSGLNSLAKTIDSLSEVKEFPEGTTTVDLEFSGSGLVEGSVDLLRDEYPNTGEKVWISDNITQDNVLITSDGIKILIPEGEDGHIILPCGIPINKSKYRDVVSLHLTYEIEGSLTTENHNINCKIFHDSDLLNFDTETPLVNWDIPLSGVLNDEGEHTANFVFSGIADDVLPLIDYYQLAIKVRIDDAETATDASIIIKSFKVVFNV